MPVYLHLLLATLLLELTLECWQQNSWEEAPLPFWTPLSSKQSMYSSNWSAGSHWPWSTCTLMAALKQVNINGKGHFSTCALVWILAHDGNNGQIQLSVYVGDRLDLEIFTSHHCWREWSKCNDMIEFASNQQLKIIYQIYILLLHNNTPTFIGMHPTAIPCTCRNVKCTQVGSIRNLLIHESEWYFDIE